MPPIPTPEWSVTTTDGETEHVRVQLEKDTLVFSNVQGWEQLRHTLSRDVLEHGTADDVENVIAVLLANIDTSVRDVRREIVEDAGIPLLPLHPRDMDKCPIIADCANVRFGGRITLLEHGVGRHYRFPVCRCSVRTCDLDSEFLMPLDTTSKKGLPAGMNDAALLGAFKASRIIANDEQTIGLSHLASGSPGTRVFREGEIVFGTPLSGEAAAAARAAQAPWNYWNALKGYTSHGVQPIVPRAPVALDPNEESIRRMKQHIAEKERATTHARDDLASKTIRPGSSDDLMVQQLMHRLGKDEPSRGPLPSSSRALAHGKENPSQGIRTPENAVRGTFDRAARPSAPASKPSSRPSASRPPAAPSSSESSVARIGERMAGKRAVAASAEEVERGLLQKYIDLSTRAFTIALEPVPRATELQRFIEAHPHRPLEDAVAQAHSAKRALDLLNELFLLLTRKLPLPEEVALVLDELKITSAQELAVLRIPGNSLPEGWREFTRSNRDALMAA